MAETPPHSSKAAVGSPIHRPMSLRRNISWSVIGNATYAGLQWLSLIALTKLQPTSDVGAFTLGLSVATPIVTLLNMELRQILSTDHLGRYPLKLFITIRVVTSIVAVMIIALFAAIGGYDIATGLVIVAVGCYKAIDAIADITFGYFQQVERMTIVAKSLILNGVLSFVGFSTVLYVTRNLLAGVVAFTIASVITLVCWNIPKMQVERLHLRSYHSVYPGESWNWPEFRRGGAELIASAWPLGAAVMVANLGTYVPRYLLEWFEGASSLGIFGALSYLVVIGGVVATAIAYSTLPRMASYYQSGNRDAYLRIVRSMVAAGIAIILIGEVLVIFAGESVVSMIYTKEYGGYTPAMMLLVLGGGAGYIATFISFGLIALEDYRTQLITNLIALIVLTVAALVLIPPMGIDGAALTIAVGAIVRILGMSWMLASNVSEKFVLRGR